MSDKKKVLCSEIAAFIGSKLIGEDRAITKPSSMKNVSDSCVVYAKTLDKCFLSKANSISNIFVVASVQYKEQLTCPHILSNNPRLDFIKIVKQFFLSTDTNFVIHKTAVVEEGAKISSNVSVGANCFIGKEVVVGSGTRIHHNVVIVGDVNIGKDCVIKSGAVIGEEGFGFEYDENGVPLHFPHRGEIIIGNGVFIGSNSTVERATIDKTIINDNVKIDDLVQIGHNCFVDENTMVMAGSILCGGATIGKNCWIAPNVSIKQKLNIGDNAYIGLGSVVLRDVLPGVTVAGVPAKELKK